MDETTDIKQERTISGAFELGAAIGPDRLADRPQIIEPLEVTHAKQLGTSEFTRSTTEPQVDPERGSGSLDSPIAILANDESQHQSDCRQNSACDNSLSEAPTATRPAVLENGCTAHVDVRRPRWTNSNEDFQAFIGASAKVVDLQTTSNGRHDSRKLSGSSKSSCINRSNSISSLAEPKPPFRFAGILSSILASLLSSLCILFVKMIPDSDGLGEKSQVLFMRGLVMLVLCSASIVSSRSTFLVGRDELLVNTLRAMFGTMGIFGSYIALNYISTGDTAAIVFSSPLWTSILSHFILGEPLHWVHFVGLPASMFGIVLIAHPTLIVPAEYLWSFDASTADTNTSSSLMDYHLDEEFDFKRRWPGIAIALQTSLFVSCSYVVLKFRKKTGIQTTTFWYSLFMTFTGATVMCFCGTGRAPATTSHWLLLLGNGVFSWLSQVAIQWAFNFEEAGLLAVIRTLDVAFTFILSAILLDDRIIWTSIVGAAIISGVVVSIVLSEWIKNLFRRCGLAGEPKKDHHQNSTVGAEQDSSGRGMQLSSKTDNICLPLPDSPRAHSAIRS